MTTNDDRPAPTTTPPVFKEIPLKSLKYLDDRKRIYGTVDPKSDEVQREVAKFRAGDVVPTPIVALDVPQQAPYILLSDLIPIVAANRAGRTHLTVQIVRGLTEAGARAQMIELHQSRPKSLLDIAMEVVYCHRAQKQLAKERQQAAGGDRKSADARRVEGSSSLPAESDGSGTGEVRDLVAKITRQSRERVKLMRDLIDEARDESKDNPRGTKIGKALAEPDADLKAVAMKFGVLETSAPKSVATSASRPSQSDREQPDEDLSSSATDSSFDEFEDSPGAKHLPTPMDVRLLAIAEHLAALEDDIENLPEGIVTRAPRRRRRAALLQALACSMSDAARRMQTSIGVDVQVPSKVTKQGPAAVRDLLLKDIVESSKALRSGLTATLGAKGSESVKVLRKGTRELEPREALAMTAALVNSRPSKSTRPI